MIAAIFSWIHPGDVKKFRSLCRMINQLLSEPFFHNLNVQNFYRRLNPTEDVVGIRYSVFPHLEKVSTTWEIVDYGPYRPTGKLSFQQSHVIGIIPVALRIAKRLKLPTKNINARSLMRMRQGQIHKMSDKDVNQKLLPNFNHATEVLVFWPPQEKHRPETVTAFVPAYQPLPNPRACDMYSLDLLPTQVIISYTVSPCTKKFRYIWKHALGRTGFNVKVNADNLLDLALSLLDKHSLTNMIIRRMPLDQSDPETAASIFKIDSNRHSTPFDPATESFYLIPVGFDEMPSPAIQTQWDLLHQKGEEAARNSQWSAAINAFRDLVLAKRDIYGIKDPRTFESYVDIAAVYLAQQKYREASEMLCDYFRNGPQGGNRAGSELVFEKAANVMQSLAEFGDCDGLKSFQVVQSEHNLEKLTNQLRPVYFKTGLFCGVSAVTVFRERKTDITLDSVNSLHASGKYLYDQGRYKEALRKFKLARDFRRLRFPAQEDELEATTAMIQAIYEQFGELD
ncbi:hypothetical protein BDR26DRAFT_922704 [Obelidium mucronatum]|nr:hypothetical protein BDR26DRAFT_922704 [Obelidium mucronatum]